MLGYHPQVRSELGPKQLEKWTFRSHTIRSARGRFPLVEYEMLGGLLPLVEYEMLGGLLAPQLSMKCWGDCSP